MIEMDQKGKSLDTILPYKARVLVGRELGKDLDGDAIYKWKMPPAQEFKLVQLYTTVVMQSVRSTQDLQKGFPLTYGGDEVVCDYGLPETEVQFTSEDGTILARVINLSSDPERGPHHDELDGKIEHRFTYHPPTEAQIPIYKEIREAGKAFAKLIAHRAPLCADQSAALRHIEDAVMTANAAIARGGK